MIGFWIAIVMLCFTGLVQIFIPYTLKKTVVFGVTIPASHIEDKSVIQVKKIYSIAVASIWLLFLVAYSIWSILVTHSEDLQIIVGTALMFLLMIVSMLFYAFFHQKLRVEKQQKQWGVNLTEVKVVDTSLRGQDEMLPFSYFISLAFVPLVLIIYTYYQYALLPEQIPTHWGPSGAPDAFTEKNRFSVISLPLLMFLMQILFASLTEGTKRSGMKISAIHPQKSAYKQLEKRKYTSWFMFLTAFLITVLFTFLQLTTIHHGIVGEGIMLTIFITFIVVTIVGSIIFSVKVSSLEKVGNDSSYPDGITDVDDDRYWKGGLMYFNKEDPSLFVEKRFGIGWTINFARPMSYLIVFVPIIIILLIAFLT
ncbi:DUF1648 domain-containing protein [Rummeliibacillus pycnus]|uniref:DUF1648 domain-containing protein n=1 Tax=Rummeliibacillus pycnus TaxID=101070 RepID=UPI0037C702E1